MTVVRGVALALLLCFPIPGFTTPPAAEVAVGAVLPDAPLNGLNGPSQRLAAYRGRPLVINVWASWCGPCRAEMDSLERLAWRSGGTAFAIIGISTDDDPRQAQAWLRTSRATLSQFIDHDLQMERLLGATRLPLTVLVGRDGRILRRIVGAREWDSAESVRLIESTFR
jgi:thiol-disulfide isomerase/thioredoxin